ncbi:MAG TPA: ABC-2 family transporter protein [Chloroflexota bacterium]|nr:ABC-2 family transporter protein [Chloroflexota bacterium]HUM67537.1 ABC-2 family transporter protein [Chloroflexota bacterium]
MRLFWEFTNRSFQRHLTYRAAAMAGLVTNFFFGILRVSVLLAILGDQESIEGYGRAELFTYMALTQAIIAYLSLFGWYDLINAVHSGEVATDLLKPMGFVNFWLARDVGRAAVALLLRGIVIMAAYSLFFDMVHPTSVAQATAVAVSLILALLISFGFRFLLNLSAFWSPNARGIGRFGFTISWFFSGFLMPLAFFPEWVQQIAYLTPFPYCLNVIVEIYTGQVTGAALWQTLIIQLLWVILLFSLAHLALRPAIKRLVILGG